ncbi:MAG: sugar transporter substrate-binding protein [Microbacteriaceae bacterium]|jgi:multiple sugar transport system substrate-binding protein|nr:sugar transporter substrate-binding protein [Microbacteriaceae bacterium]
MQSRLSKHAFVGVAVATTAALALGGCSAQPASDPGAKPETLRVLYTTSEANVAALQAQVPAFEDEFGIKLAIDTQPYDALQQKVFSEFASSSDYYDIVVVDTPWAPALVGNLEPLSAYIENSSLNKKADANVADFIPKVLYDTAVYDASDPLKQYPDPTEAGDAKTITNAGFDIYGLPIQANVAVMGYRKDLFDDPTQKANFQAEFGRELSVPQTWDEYAEVAKFFTQPDKNLYGTTVMAGVGDWATDDFKTLLASFGGDAHLVTDDLSLAFDTEEGVAALEYYTGLIDSGVVPPGSTSASWDETATSFDTGLSAMTINYHALELADNVGGEIGYAPVPHGKDASDVGPHFGTWMLSLNKNSKNKDWAYQAISWLTSSDQQLAMTADQLHPSRTSVYDAVENQTDNPAEAEFYSTLGGSLEVGVGRARLTNYTEVSHAIAVAVNKASSGELGPKAALDEASDSVTSLLEQAGYTVSK